MMTSETHAPTRPSARPALAALAAIALYWLAEIVAQIGYYGPGGQIDIWGIQSALAHSAVIVIGLLVGHALVGRIDLALRSTMLIFLLGAVLNLAVWAWVGWLGPFQAEATRRAMQNLVLLPQLVLLVWLLRAPMRRWVLSGIAMAAAFLFANDLVARHFILESLYTFPDLTAEAPPLDVEALYAAQDGLLKHQFAGLGPGTPGTPDAFALLVAGTSDQSVFLAEVESVTGILDTHFASGPRSLRLANSDTDPRRYPLANRVNLERALVEIGARQGPEDVAFLFLTSHGRAEEFSLDFHQAGTTDLTSSDFAAMLTRAKIGPAVIVVSACFSGSFIDDIAAPDRLIITAARGDRTSFGCRDGAEWTEFGQSFFDLALRADPDPRKAFAVAAKDVKRKELAAGLTPSEPQISEGAEIGKVIDRLLSRQDAQDG